MENQYLFSFKTDISSVYIPKNLNNPFGSTIPDIVRVATMEFQEYISSESQKWGYDFDTNRGKMFGILVVQKADNTYGYLGTVSGKLPGNVRCDKFIPSVLDNSSADFYFNKGMTELTEIGNEIKMTNNLSKVSELSNTRRLKSIALQQRIFEDYVFLDLIGNEKNVIQIFEDSTHNSPPAASGECAAPKLLQYSLKNQLRPIALAEFWWGAPPKGKERKHKVFYPACKDKCRPILEYMLNDTELFEHSSKVSKEYI